MSVAAGSCFPSKSLDSDRHRRPLVPRQASTARIVLATCSPGFCTGLCSGTARGFSCAQRQLALLLRLRRPAGYGFPSKSYSQTARKDFSGPSVNGTWEHGPLARDAPTKGGANSNPRTPVVYQNKVTLMGFLGRDPELRNNGVGRFTTLSVATKSTYRKDETYLSCTEWHRGVAFGKLSDFAATLKTRSAYSDRRRAAQPGSCQSEERFFANVFGRFGSVPS